MLRQNNVYLDCSSAQLDGSHTPAKNGWAVVGYQGRKKARPTTALFLTDNRGQLLLCVSPPAVNHHDSHRPNVLFGKICTFLEAAGVPVAGLFLNANKDSDTNELHQKCARRDIGTNTPPNRRAADWQNDDDVFFDPELYRRRVVAEHANAWLDGFKTLLVCYGTSVKPASAICWSGTGPPSSSSFCEKSTKNPLSKRLKKPSGNAPGRFRQKKAGAPNKILLILAVRVSRWFVHLFNNRPSKAKQHDFARIHLASTEDFAHPSARRHEPNS